MEKKLSSISALLNEMEAWRQHFSDWAASDVPTTSEASKRKADAMEKALNAVLPLFQGDDQVPSGRICRKEHSLDVLTDSRKLPRSQRQETGRHVCAACAYEAGYRDALVVVHDAVAALRGAKMSWEETP